MGEYESETFQLEAVTVPAQPISVGVAEARSFASGLVLAVAIAAAGAALLTAGLLVLVVASPLLAVALVWLAMRPARGALRAPRRSDRSAW